jgi:hypothetical protein
MQVSVKNQVVYRAQIILIPTPHAVEWNQKVHILKVLQTAPRINSITANDGSDMYRAIFDIEVTWPHDGSSEAVKQYIHDKWIQSCNLLNITTETT